MKQEPCQKCGGDLYRFEPGPRVKGVDASKLPTACRRCGDIMLEGQSLSFPPAFLQKVAGIADEAARQGKAVRGELEKDPASRIEKYFDQTYRRGFLDGFFRAVAFFSYQSKEGRLKRLRKLWHEAMTDDSENSSVLVRMSIASYREFKQLLDMGLATRQESPHAEDPANVHSAGKTG